MGLILTSLIGFGVRRAGTVTFINPSGKTKIGNMTTFGGLAAAFDGTTSQALGVACGIGGTGLLTGTAGVDWGSGVTKTVTRFEVWASSDYGFNNWDPAEYTMEIRLQGSNDNSAWTTLYTTTVLDADGYYLNVTGGIDTSTAYRYHRIQLSDVDASTSGHSIGLAEIKFYETLT